MGESEQLSQLESIVASQALFNDYLTGGYGGAAQEEMLSLLPAVLDISNSSIPGAIYKQTNICLASALTNSDINIKAHALAFLFSALSTTENENQREGLFSILAKAIEMVNDDKVWFPIAEHKLGKVFGPLDKLLESPGADSLVASVCSFISSTNRGGNMGPRYSIAYSIYNWLALNEGVLSDTQRNTISAAIISTFEKKGWKDIIKPDTTVTIAESRGLAHQKLAPAKK